MSKTNKLQFIEAMLNWFASPSMGRELDVKFLSDAYDDITSPAWVSVEDELPKITIDGWRSEDVFFATDDGKSHFGFYSNKGVWFSSVYGFNGHQVTHWMPLPTKPVKKGGQDETD